MGPIVARCRRSSADGGRWPDVPKGATIRAGCRGAMNSTPPPVTSHVPGRPRRSSRQPATSVAAVGHAPVGGRRPSRHAAGTGVCLATPARRTPRRTRRRHLPARHRGPAGRRGRCWSSCSTQACGFRGGFVGVDVFFVLSGFLITALLLRELAATGTISLTQFYARRARRLLPGGDRRARRHAPAVGRVPAAPARAGSCRRRRGGRGLRLEHRLRAAGDRLLRAVPGTIADPALWSLGVEEQFYLVWPAILLLVAGAVPAVVGGSRSRSRGHCGVVRAVPVGSRARASPGRSSPSDPRLGAGTRGGARGRRVASRQAARERRRGGRLAGPRAHRGCGRLPRPDDPVPGTAALLPTVGAALVVAGGARRNGSGRRPFSGWLCRGSSAGSRTRCISGTGRSW